MMRNFRKTTGFTLVELIVAVVLIALALFGLVSAIYGTTQVNLTNSEIATASRASQKMFEKMMDEDFARAFASFNEVPEDDPGGPGTAPGAWFNVPGLTPPRGRPAAGRIYFPTRKVAGALQLREDVFDDALRMPRDLNGDGIVDALPHNGDYQLLPVRIRIEWVDSGGRTMAHESAAILTRRK